MMMIMMDCVYDAYSGGFVCIFLFCNIVGIRITVRCNFQYTKLIVSAMVMSDDTEVSSILLYFVKKVPRN